MSMGAQNIWMRNRKKVGLETKGAKLEEPAQKPLVYNHHFLQEGSVGHLDEVLALDLERFEWGHVEADPGGRLGADRPNR